MYRRSTILLASSAFALTSAPAFAQLTPAAESADNIVVTATRTILPANALPLTIDVIDQETLNQQVAIGGSIVDAVSALTPSFSPTRQKLHPRDGGERGSLAVSRLEAFGPTAEVQTKLPVNGTV